MGSKRDETRNSGKEKILQNFSINWKFIAFNQMIKKQ